MGTKPDVPAACLCLAACGSPLSLHLQDFASKLVSCRRIAVVGNGGIALELV